MLGGMRRWRVSLGWSFRGGSGFNILSLTLIGLKLGGVISWPWSMVLLPLWFTLGVLFIIGLGIATAVVGARVSQYVQDRRSGEPVALLVPSRREPNLERRSRRSITYATGALGPVLTVPEIGGEGPGHGFFLARPG